MELQLPQLYVLKGRHSDLVIQPPTYSPFEPGEMPEPIEPPNDLLRSLRTIFETLLTKYETSDKPDKIVAGNKIHKLYLLASEQGKKDLSSSLGFGLSQQVYSSIGVNLAGQRNYLTAIEFTKKAHPNDDVALTNRGIYLTKLAQQTTDPLAQLQYHKEAFNCFEKAAPFDHIAQKHYFHSLINGIGCTTQTIASYFNQQVKCRSENNRERMTAIENMESLANKGDMQVQCMLATAYYSGTNGLSQSTEKSLLMCRYYLQSLAQCTKIEQLPMQRFIFDKIIKDLSGSNQKIIADQSQKLARYMDLFMANLAKDQHKIESLTRKNPLDKLLCKNYTKSSAHLQEIKKMTPAELKSIGELETSIIKDMARSISDNSTEQSDTINYLCGIIAYNDKNYKKAYHHLLQCSAYAKNDLLTHSLVLRSQYHLQKNKQTTIQQVLDQMGHINALLKETTHKKLNERNATAQQDILALYQDLHKSYEITLLKNNQYNLAYQLIGHLLSHTKTTESALSMLLAMERIINTADQQLIQHIDHQLRNTIDTAVNALILKNLSPGTLRALVEFLSEKAVRPSLSPEQKSNYLKQALEYLPHHASCKNATVAEWSKALRTKLLVTIGILDKSIPHLDEAIALGNFNAGLHKMNIILALPTKTPAQIKELMELLAIVGESNHPDRSYSLNGLGYYYYNLSLSSSNMEDRKKAFDYFHKAIAADNNAYAYLLGSLYLKGIPKYVEADIEKSLYYFNKQTEFSESISHNHLIAFKAHAHYQQEKYQEALDILIANIPTEMTPLRAEFLWLMGMTKIQIFNANILDNEVVNYCVQAYNAFRQCPHSELVPIETIQSITDEKFLKTAEHKTAHILFTNNKTALALEFCNIMGQLLWRSTQEKPLTDERRKTAIRYIRYAADNGNANAQEFTVYTDIQEILLSDKLYYLETAYAQRIQENSTKAETIQKLLEQLYPETLAQQANLISYYIKKNNISFLQKYIQQLYNTRSPLITLEMSQKDGEDLIKTCYDNELLVQAANNFIKNPKEATPFEKHAAIFLGSLLAYSYDQKQLLQAARYLEQAQLDSAEQNERIKDNKGILYYKLGCLADAPDNPRPNPQLATMFYQKGADLGNGAAQIELLRLLSGLKVSFVPKAAVKNNNRK